MSIFADTYFIKKKICTWIKLINEYNINFCFPYRVSYRSRLYFVVCGFYRKYKDINTIIPSMKNTTYYFLHKEISIFWVHSFVAVSFAPIEGRVLLAVHLLLFIVLKILKTVFNYTYSKNHHYRNIVIIYFLSMKLNHL